VVSDNKTSHIVLETDYDDNGNVIGVVYYDRYGQISLKQEFPPCSKRKFVKYNNDGSFYGETCLDAAKQ
jgi:hypothetical protein